MFKFGFSSDDNNENDYDETKIEEKWFESEKITPSEVILKDNYTIKSIQCGQITIKYVSEQDVIDRLKDDKSAESVLNAEQNHSDLITGVYEGGLKVWECTFDMLNYINNENLDLTGKKVLDLGCGAGIIGILSSLKGSQTVFQDYNAEVIKSSTIHNVSLNNISLDTCTFYSGDWGSFLATLKDTNIKFDFIFTSETIYNINNYKKILSIFRHLLHENGIIYLAAKTHYFGVGGGLIPFQDSLGPDFNYTTCWTSSNGMKRAILKITKNHGANLS